MSAREGVIKFKLDHESAAAVNHPAIITLNHWRTVLARLGLIGADPGRYHGLGFGNLSARLEGGGFLITASQTGMLSELTASHYAHVVGSWPEQNRIQSCGPMQPSSESLTHAAIYQANRDIRYVFHCHSPEIWLSATRLGIPLTPAELAYGTAELAATVTALVPSQQAGCSGIFAMAGHEDGVVAFAATAAVAGNTLVKTLAVARTGDGSHCSIN